MNKLFFIVMLMGSAMLTSCFDTEEPFDASEQFHNEQAAIEEYLTTNGLTTQQDSVHDLHYTVEAIGNGEFPKDNSYVTVSYTGSVLSTGSVFDEGDSVAFLLGGLIPGWRILLPYISEEGQMTMYIPSFFAYGNAAVNEIPANSTLVFDVELHRVEGEIEYQTRTIEERFIAEQKLINEYIEENNLTASIDTVQSLRYVIVEEGTGDHPTATSKVKVDYEGRFLKDDKVFDSGTGATFDLKNLIKGWQILMPYVKEGGTIMMFIPSKFAYGTSGFGTIPANTALIFEVKLDEIVE